MSLSTTGCSKSKESENKLNEEEFVEQLVNVIVLEDDSTKAKAVETTEVKVEDGKTAKKLTSKAWDHFKIIMVNGVQKAKCNYCTAILKRSEKNNELWKGKEVGGDECGDEEDTYAQAKRTKKRKVHVRGEVEHYLDDDPIPENDAFDVLDWWKRDQMYPTLQKIAKDILAIPVSSVASESAFSTGGRVVSAHRSRLHSRTVEALMCLQNWMIDDVKGELDDTSACSTVNEDYDEDGEEQIDIIDMDVDDVESSCAMDDDFYS
ncbi:uncharacterized protein LOC131008352 [Salvia miltiorrhiza]|uniref:uncharacterized protein LOC131008352 n=1 Tax=Salvia miltiorrhiza TaxID=226208 RepID=UPI0025AC7325|nr:uncharacterized protein LOC131008352 [Salvia miltiorrhiza]